MTLAIVRVAPNLLTIERTCPKSLVIISTGYTPTTGWSRGKIVPRTPNGKAYNGVYEFDFVAEMPIGITLLRVSEIASEPYVWKNIPPDLKVIRINGVDNFVEKELE